MVRAIVPNGGYENTKKKVTCIYGTCTFLLATRFEVLQRYLPMGVGLQLATAQLYELDDESVEAFDDFVVQIFCVKMEM